MKAQTPIRFKARTAKVLLSRDEARFAGITFVIVLAIGGAWMFREALLGLAEQTGALLALLALLGIGALDRRAHRMWRRPFRRKRERPLFGAGAPLATGTMTTLQKPWVIDGDTIDDLASRTRYRLHNIDAPETEDRAKSKAERMLGHRAKVTAIAIVRAAKRVEARGTGRFDVYGRTVAYVLVDGKDLGELLMERGLALPWRGRQEDWSALH